MSEVKSKERMKDQNRDQTERENEEGNCCEEIFIDRRGFFSPVFFLFIPSSLHHLLRILSVEKCATWRCHCEERLVAESILVYG